MNVAGAPPSCACGGRFLDAAVFEGRQYDVTTGLRRKGRGRSCLVRCRKSQSRAQWRERTLGGPLRNRSLQLPGCVFPLLFEKSNSRAEKPIRGFRREDNCQLADRAGGGFVERSICLCPRIHLLVLSPF
jgi:hypothetical protein